VYCKTRLLYGAFRSAASATTLPRIAQS